MLRFQLFTIGRAWVSEYGSSENPKEFDNLYKYSPLHTVKPIKYPAMLITTGDHDDRVVPLHAFKYAATLQDVAGKVPDQSPLLIAIQKDGGHGGAAG
jgi:prolyl oligopeptidase